MIRRVDTQTAGRVSRRGLLAAAAAAAAAAASAGCETVESRPSSPTPSPTGGSSGSRFPGDPGPGRLYLGTSLSISTPARARPAVGGADVTMTRRFYRAHQVDLMARVVATDVTEGIMPFVSFKAPDAWDAMASGRGDRWMAGLASAAAGLQAPMFLTLHHEPENDVDSVHHTVASWRAMQRRLIRVMQDAPLVTVVPVLQRWTFDARSQRTVDEWLVDEAVVQGIDLYNNWDPGGEAQWDTFSELWEPIRQQLPPGPCVIPELGCVADPFDPGRVPLWLAEAVDVALVTDVVGMTWFESDIERRKGRFRLDEAGRAEFRRQLRRPEIARLGPPVS